MIVRALDVGFNIACRRSAEDCIDRGDLSLHSAFGNRAVAPCLVVEGQHSVAAVRAELPELDVLHISAVRLKLFKILAVRLKGDNLAVAAVREAQKLVDCVAVVRAEVNVNLVFAEL